MQVTAIKTHAITKIDTDILVILDAYLPAIPERSVVVVTSKIVSICEGRMVRKTSDFQKDALATQEADLYLPREYNQYGFMITIKNNIMIASAGIDESNGNGYLILWPKNPQKSANSIREHIVRTRNVRNIGVIIADSKLTPLRWGVTGVAIAHSGFEAIYSYIGKKDIFERVFHAEKSNIADALATAAVVVMGEGIERQPLAVITDIPFVHFQQRNPTKKELDGMHISLHDDVYASLLASVPWKKKKRLKSFVKHFT